MALADQVVVVGEVAQFDGSSSKSNVGGQLSFAWTAVRDQSDHPYRPNPDYETTTFEGPTFDFNVVRTGSWAVTLTVTDRLGATDTSSARVFSRFEFRDNLNGTATNNQTSLMWQLQDDGNQYTLAEARGLPVLSPGDNNGLNVCGDLSLAGFNDWRVPTLPEAQSVLDFTRAPIPFASALLSTTRSSSLYISNSWIPNSMADYISSADGQVHHVEVRTRTYVRCVRP